MSFWDGTRWVVEPAPTRPVRRRGSRPLDWVVTALMVVGLAVILVPSSQSQAAGPRLTVSPFEVRPGDNLRVSGSGFPANATIRLLWDGSTRLVPFVRVGRNGTFSTQAVVGTLAPGAHDLAAQRISLGIGGTARRLSVEPLAVVKVSVLGAAAAAEALEVPPTPAAEQPTAAPTAVPTELPTAVPTAAPPAPATAGLPTIDPSYGTLFRKVFTDGKLGPFRVLTYPDDHIGGSGQDMTVFNRYSNGAAQLSVHGGYLDLRCTRRSDGLWDAVLVGTSQGGNGPTFGYGVYRFWLRFNAAPATWQAAWLYDTTSWSATEIDFPEMLENGSLTAHVLGQGAGAKYGIAHPGSIGSIFHEYTVERRASFVAFSIDGREVARVNGSMPSSKLAILLDSKVGFPWAAGPSGSTPGTVYLHVAAVTVDP